MPPSRKRVAAGVTVAGLVGAGAIALGAKAFADPTTTPSPGQSTSAGSTAPTQPAPYGSAKPGKPGDRAGRGPHTPVTGDEATKVKDAVTAKFAGVTITTVLKDADGSYDAIGTKADGTRVMYDVSKDLATITEHVGGKGGGPGGPGAHGTPVTGDEATKVKDAVVAKNPGVTITEVRKDPDGSYDAIGTKADGSKVFYDVSKDLATITERPHR